MSQRMRGPEAEPVVVEAEDYEDAVENSIGWCLSCQEFTRECTEPDAEGYDCPQCGENHVVGAEDALIGEHIVINEQDQHLN